MALPTPHPGLVISYAYLWADEQAKGREEGTKDRPCAIVVARRMAEDKTIVTVVAITHTPPADPLSSIEMPPALKEHLGLDAGRSWVVLSEYNEFLWPGPDLRQVTPAKAGDFSYGVLPPNFFRQLRDQLVALVAERRVRHIRRTE